jgi:hypothetical protein
MMLGQRDDRGGAVYLNRLSRILARSVILAKGGRDWILEYLFEKKDEADIDRDDLIRFR